MFENTKNAFAYQKSNNLPYINLNSKNQIYEKTLSNFFIKDNYPSNYQEYFSRYIDNKNINQNRTLLKNKIFPNLETQNKVIFPQIIDSKREKSLKLKLSKEKKEESCNLNTSNRYKISNNISFSLNQKKSDLNSIDFKRFKKSPEKRLGISRIGGIITRKKKNQSKLRKEKNSNDKKKEIINNKKLEKNEKRYNFDLNQLLTMKLIDSNFDLVY